jgi:hypothetical protein
MRETVDDLRVVDVSNGEAICGERDRSSDRLSVVSSRKRALEKTGDDIVSGPEEARARSSTKDLRTQGEIHKGGPKKARRLKGGGDG